MVKNVTLGVSHHGGVLELYHDLDGQGQEIAEDHATGRDRHCAYRYAFGLVTGVVTR